MEEGGSFLDTFIGEGTKIKGEINFKGLISVNGTFDGKINSEGGTVVVNDKAKVKAEIKSSKVIVRGNFNGYVELEDKFEAYPPAVINGDIKAPTILMSEGVIFNGNCFMDKKKRKLAVKPVDKIDTDKIDKKKKKTLLKSLTNIFSKDM